MTEDAFWKVIESSRRDFDPKLRDGNMERQGNLLEEALSELSVEEIVEFAQMFAHLLRQAYRWDLWGAAYVIGSGCSDDGFMDFRSWLISMGRSVFDAALADPESLVGVADAPGVECAFFEGFSYVANDLLEKKGADPDAVATVPLPDDPVGEKWDEEDLPNRFPRLWAAFGTR